MLLLFVLSVYLWVSRHKTVDVVVDLLEHKASVHQVETALQTDGGKQFRHYLKQIRNK